METTEERLAFVEEQWDRLALWAYSKFKEVGRGAVRVWLSERRKVGDGYDYPVDYLAYWPEAIPGVNTNWPPDQETINALKEYNPEAEIIIVLFKDRVVGQCDLYRGRPNSCMTPRQKYDEAFPSDSSKTPVH